MADEIPAGWYPDIHGTVRWWDGNRWTDHIRESGSAAGASAPAPTPTAEVHTPEPTRPAAPRAAGMRTAEPSSAETRTFEPATAATTTTTAAPSAPATPATPATPTTPAAQPYQAPRPADSTATPHSAPPLEPRRSAADTAVLSTQAADVARSSLSSPQGFATSPSAGSTSTDVPIHRPSRTISYPKTVEEEIEEDDDGANRRLWLTATAVGLATFFLGMGIGGRTTIDPPGTSDPIPPAVNAEPSDIEQLRQQLEERQAQLDERQQVLDDREDELDRRAAAPPSPSPTPTPTPTPTATATETEIDGNDRVLVGTDVREGTYRTNGPTDPTFECEYAISKDEFGDDPISEDSTKTARSVTLRDGDWFETDDCQDWTRE